MKKKSFLNLGKKMLFKSKKPFLKNKNTRIVLAAIVGATAGVLITRLIGSDKVREVFTSLEGNIKDLSHKFTNGSKEAALKLEKAS